MSLINNIKATLDSKKLFNSETNKPNYIRLLDTPHVFGLPFNDEIINPSNIRKKEMERAVEEIIQKTTYRCDIASLDSPDVEWGKIILRSIDICLSQKKDRTKPVQFRFLFGSMAYGILPTTDAVIDFKASLIRLIRERSSHWEVMPDIYLGIYVTSVNGKLSLPSLLSPENYKKITWNHAKVIASDGTESLVGGHNLWMNTLNKYPPVHDISAVFHGQSALSSQLYLNELWACGSDLLSKLKLDIVKLKWIDITAQKIQDPLAKGEIGFNALEASWAKLIQLHQAEDKKQQDKAPQKIAKNDFKIQLIETPEAYTTYAQLEKYKLADRVLCVGKYWSNTTNQKLGSEIMKETLIKSAKKIIRMSQQDIFSALSNSWAEHHVAQWLIEALLANPKLEVQIVLSPLDASAGLIGDQYSFGSGAERTMELIRYYMTHDAKTDKILDDKSGKRADALKRIKIAPLFFTDKIDEDHLLEGVNYKWPNSPLSSYTASFAQKPLSINPPSKGNIGSIVEALINASGIIYPKVPPAPANHAKLTIIDEELYVIGSDNMYPSDLAEIDMVVEGSDAVKELLESYWNPLWKYSSPHAVK